MADADAMLIRKLIVAALEGGDAHTDLRKPFGTRSVISFRYLAEEWATGIFSGVSPAAHSLAAFRALMPMSGRVNRPKIACVESFVFRIGDTFDTPEGFDGETTLAGVRIGNGNLAIGDAVLVPVRAGGRVRAVCAGFPLMSFLQPRVACTVDHRLDRR